PAVAKRPTFRREISAEHPDFTDKWFIHGFLLDLVYGLSFFDCKYYGRPMEVASTFAGRATPSGPRRNQTAKLCIRPLKTTLKAFATRPGWKTVIWPRFWLPGVKKLPCPIGIRTGAPVLLSYPKCAVNVPLPLRRTHSRIGATVVGIVTV